MKFLSIETSTKYSSISIFDTKKSIFGARRLFEKGHSDGLDILVSEAIKRTGLSLADIDAFGAGTGPGSFTGLRIGLSMIKGLAYALRKPCYGFSSLDSIAHTVTDESIRHLGVIVDAKRGNVYCRFYKRKDGWIPVSPAALLPVEGIYRYLRPFMAFCGDAVSLHKGTIENKAKDVTFLGDDFWYPTPESIAALTQKCFRLGDKKTSFELAATYLYEQDCQIKKAC